MASQSTARRLRFRGFEFDVIAGELYRDGQRVRLQEQPRQVLVALLERPGEVVTREELRERLWKSDTFVDFEHGLNTAIKKVRQALGDSADAPVFIETLAKRGYRFVASTQAPEEEPVGAAPPSARGSGALGHERSAGASSRSRRRTPLWLVGAALVPVALMVGLRVWLPSADSAAVAPPSTPAATAQLAVLPLRVLGDTEPASSSYIGVGIADAIITRLANIRQIALRPTSAVLAFRDGEFDPVRVASALGVKHLLLGTVEPAERSYRVRVQLVSADGTAIWGRAYDEPRGSLLELQDQIAEQVASALQVELTPPERARLHVRYTKTPAAYDLYLRGRALLVNYTEDNMREAMGRFEQALAFDRDYALARAALATGAAWFSVRYAYETDALAWGRRADYEARRALQQDPQLADAHLAIASAAGTLYGGFDWKAVLESTAAGLALDPSMDLAHVVRMRALYHMGFFAEAREEAALARALNPFPNVEVERLGVAISLFEGDFALAARQAAEILGRHRSDMPAVRHYLGLARYYTGDVAGAREILASVRRKDRPDVRSQASLASIEAASGMHDAARERVAEILRGSYMDHHVAYSLAAAFAQLGDADASLRWLRRAAGTGFPCVPWFERDSLLTPLRQQREFQHFVDALRTTNDRTVRRSVSARR